jgi:hypothetical protein
MITKYKLTVTKITSEEYDEIQDVWVGEDGTRYATKYSVPDEVKANKITEKTGKKLDREESEVIYSQTFDDLDIAALTIHVNE